MQVSHAIATALNAALVIIRGFSANKEQGAKIRNLFATAAEENRDVGADEIQAIIDSADNALDNLDAKIEEKE